jgi:hypothetical protein
MNYSLEIDWTLNLLCNYHCSYCFSRADAELPETLAINPFAALELFERTGKTCLVHFTGGEPFLHPKFIQLCQLFTQNHFIAMNTNLSSGKGLLQLIQTVEPERVGYVHVGVHPVERDRVQGWDILYNRLDLLVKLGFATFASCVLLTSNVMDRFERLQDEMWYRSKTVLIPKAERGGMYGASDAQRFNLMAARAQQMLDYNPMGGYKYAPTVNPLLDDQFLNGFPDFTGINCRAGIDFISIDHIGKIWRCGRHRSIGDLRTGVLVLDQYPSPCDEYTCPYFCLKYSDFYSLEKKPLPVSLVQLESAMGESLKWGLL